MIRAGMSFIFCFVLFYIQSVIVMKLSGYEQGIYFENYGYVAVVCCVNFFLIFSILTQIKPWFLRLNQMNTEEFE
jgi:hypothetical protein